MDELTITEDDLRGFDPCYDDDRMEEALAGVTFPITARGILALDHVPIEDRMWVVLRPELIPERTLREFACDCAERAMANHGNGDPRSLNAIAVARRFAADDATPGELSAAGDAAWAALAARAARAARDAAGAAAGAARAAARAAGAAAGAAAGGAAWDAAWAARAAAWDAWAARAARDAARAAWAAGDAESEWQLVELQARLDAITPAIPACGGGDGEE